MAENTLGFTLWLLLNDQEFLKQNPKLRSDLFPRGSSRYLAGLSLSQWQESHHVVTPTIVELATETETAALKRAGAEKDAVREVYGQIQEAYYVDPTSLPLTRKLCRDWLEKRAVQSAIQQADEAVGRGDLNAAHKHLSGAMLPVVQEEPQTHLSMVTTDFLQTLRKPKAGAIPTGFTDLDQCWSGGYREGEVGMLAGHTGVGKSQGLCAMTAHAFWEGANVVYYTYELSPEQIKERIALGILGLGKDDTHEDWVTELTRAARNRKREIPMADIDIRNSEQTWPAIMAYLEEYKVFWGKYPDVLMLDSADDVAPLANAGDQQWQQLTEAYTFLRRQAQHLKIRIWSTAQLKQEAVEKARVSLKHIGYAFGKAQKAHYVLGLAQTEQDKNHIEGPKIQLYVLKDSLHGTTGGHLECAARFGFGQNGYPGYSVEYTHNLPI